MTFHSCPVHMRKINGKELLISVSAFAVIAAPPLPVMAQSTVVSITCKQDIDIGKLIASGCAGTYIIAPDGAHKNSGCLLINSTAVVGVCTVSTKKGPATKNAVVTFAKASYTLSAAPTGTVTMKALRMQVRGRTTSATKVTLTPTELKNTATLDIGGSLHYVDMQTAGKYSGKVAVSVNWQ